MPRYQYECNCGNEAIKDCKMSEYSPTITCDCGKEMTRKVANMVCGYQAKYSGFYGKKSN